MCLFFVCVYNGLTSESLDLEDMCFVCPVKFVYRGHWIKIKVIGANKPCLCPVWALNFECIDI